MLKLIWSSTVFVLLQYSRYFNILDLVSRMTMFLIVVPGSEIGITWQYDLQWCSQAPSHIALYISLRCKMQPDFPPSAWNQSGFLRWAGSNALWPLFPTGEPSSWHEIVQFGVGKKLTRMHEIQNSSQVTVMCEPKSYLCFKAFTWTSMLRFEGGSGAVVIEAENINKL